MINYKNCDVSNFMPIVIIFLIFFNLYAYPSPESLQDFYGNNSAKFSEILNETEQALRLAKPGEVKKVFRDFTSSSSFSVKLYEGENFNYIEKIFSFKDANVEINKIKALNEYIAYNLDKQIGLKIVPPTIYFQNPSKINSYIVRQLYIDKSYTPDEEDALRENDSDSSDSDDSSSSSFGDLVDYLKNDTALIIFDKLMGMTDREFNNYLISYDGTVFAIDHESLFQGNIFQNFSNLEYLNENDIRSFFYESSIYDNFIRMNWENWVSTNLPQGIYTEDQKNRFTKNIYKLKDFTEKTIKRDGSKDEFFRKAKEARETSLNVKKLLFLKNQNKNNSSLFKPANNDNEASETIPDFDLLMSDDDC